MSSLRFIICIEILSNHFQQNDNNKGIKLNDTELKQTLYVDDATYYTDGSVDDATYYTDGSVDDATYYTDGSELKQTLYVDDATYYTDGSELKQTLYVDDATYNTDGSVDDATYYTDGSETSLSELSFSIEEFGKISGLRLNSSKTIVMRIGALRNSNTTCPNFKHFKWTSNSAKPY